VKKLFRIISAAESCSKKASLRNSNDMITLVYIVAVILENNIENRITLACFWCQSPGV